ncbi:1-acyl-sn-glycerol-3-phosphate acyltransferase [Caldibacillus thermolactis]|uniref:1-acyl-sn-glycerol-3-phosphate acyltransferase n=1 Tax=Pallidibacillus thermolactis TaxID=251051 RepID=A0ABT2WDF6_9BACI|nr:lysophospholipid acyltransferase family protein [Pallidibacillus thermolactis]MCU9593721.1 1-acyl-sn-glycerol-3-phosphate acyltransferase [Pallidibacillus thermolactis]MED1673807.1 lysophospholipid acyltransferase family protein [Pallidibacillus thermolactis subsp. kokeshiiformis]
MNFYTVARGIVKLIMSCLYRIETKGLENIPKEGAVLLCANHIHNLDPPLVGITMKRPVVFMAKEELFKVPILGKIVRKANAFPIKRGKADREAIRIGLKTLREGKVLGIFPEGTRSRTGELGKGLSGVGFFALRSDATVIPCAIIGPYKLFRKVKIIYGNPVNFNKLKDKNASIEEATELIMTHIREILIQYK